MKAVFVHDHNFVYNPEDRLYYDGSGGAFNKKLWKRYLALFDHLTVVGRQKDALPNNLVSASCENVTFELMIDSGKIQDTLMYERVCKERMEKIISDTDFAIIRLPSKLGAWAFNICKKQNKKYVLEIVGDPFYAYWYHGNILGKIIAPVELVRLKGIVKNAKDVIYVTQNNLQNRYPCLNRTESISNVRLESLVEKKDVSGFYEAKSDKIILGLIGSFHVKYKGHLESIKALHFLKTQGYTNLELRLVGTGNPDWVRELITRYNLDDQVKILGSLNAGSDGVYPFLDHIHIYIHPSKTEGLPRVILESMSRGRVCLGSDVGGTNELLTPEFIHAPGKWRVLATQIQRLIELSPESFLKIAEDNLTTAGQYLEETLQKRRINFISKII